MTLTFVDPSEAVTTYRVLLWGAPGEGKTVAAVSAPGPILAISADRPTAYKFARGHHGSTEVREYRYVNAESLEHAFRYLSSDEGSDVRTVVLDPISNIVDGIVDEAPQARDGGADYQWVNQKVTRFIKALRRFDVNLVIVAHEKLNDGKKGDGKLYPAVGGPALVNKVLAEMDIVAHVERHVRHTDGGEQPVWVGQLQPTPGMGGMVCKESTGALGPRRVLDLTRWFSVANGEDGDQVADQAMAEFAAIDAGSER